MKVPELEAIVESLASEYGGPTVRAHVVGEASGFGQAKDGQLVGHTDELYMMAFTTSGVLAYNSAPGNDDEAEDPYIMMDKDGEFTSVLYMDLDGFKGFVEDITALLASREQ